MKYKTRFLWFFFAMVLFSLASNFAHPVTPTVIQNLALHDYMFGVALAVMMTANFLMSPFWGKINNYISSRLSLLICCSGYGVAQLWFACSKTELMIACARIFAGVFVGGIFVSFLTYIVNAAQAQDQGKFLIYSATIQSVGGAFGYLIGGVLGEVSVSLAFWAQALLLIATGILFFFICVPDKKDAEPLSGRELLRQANPLRAFIDCRSFMTRTFVMLFLLNILFNFANTGFDQAFNYFLKDQVGLTSSYNGLIKAAVGLISFAANMTLSIWIVKKTNCGRSVLMLTIACALASFWSVLTPRIGWFIVSAILVYAGFSISLPVLQNMVAEQASPEQKNLVMGFYNATKSLGGILGSLTAGFIYSVQAKLPFLCTALIYVVSIGAAIGYLHFSAREKADPAA